MTTLIKLVSKDEFRKYLAAKGYFQCKQGDDVHNWKGEVWCGDSTDIEDLCEMLWIPLDEVAKEETYNPDFYQCANKMVDLLKFEATIKELREDYDRTHCSECGQYIG